MDVRQLVGAFGGEVVGQQLLDLSADEVLDAVQRWQLLVCRDQVLSAAELTTLARRLGKPERYPFAAPVNGHEFVVEIRKEPDDAHNFGGAWHSDTTYLERPPGLTLLLGVEVPERGDTLFADMYAAFEGLSPGLQHMLAPLRAHFSSRLVHDPRGDHASVAGDRPDDGVPEHRAVHPIVRRHPVTGRDALYINGIHTERFAGMTRAESLPMIEYLTTLATRADLTSRLRWRPGTLAIWDNRCVQHYPLNDYAGCRRVMLRVILEGETPQGPDDAEGIV